MKMILTPIKAIRKHCIECSGFSRKEVAICIIKSCPLHPYRMGIRPSTLQKRLDRSINNEK